MRATVDVLSMSATPIPAHALPRAHRRARPQRDRDRADQPPSDPDHRQDLRREDRRRRHPPRDPPRRPGVLPAQSRADDRRRRRRSCAKLLPDLTIGVGHGQMNADGSRGGDDRVRRRHATRCSFARRSSRADSISRTATRSSSRARTASVCRSSTSSAAASAASSTRPTPTCCSTGTRACSTSPASGSTAMRQHTQLGAGFRIAMRDLELRGAGNLLGAEQSGHIVGVGFELYCQLLRQSVARLKGEKTAAAIRASVKLDFVFVGESPGAGAAPVRGRHEDSYTAIRDAEIEAGGAEIARIQARIPVTGPAVTGSVLTGPASPGSGRNCSAHSVPRVTGTAASRPSCSARPCPASSPNPSTRPLPSRSSLRSAASGTLLLLGRVPIAFDVDEDVILHRRKRLEFHSNAMRFTALNAPAPTVRRGPTTRSAAASCSARMPRADRPSWPTRRRCRIRSPAGPAVAIDAPDRPASQRRHARQRAGPPRQDRG